MSETGVQTTVHCPCVHQFSYYRSLFPEQSLPRSEAFASRELTLPLHPKLGNANVELVVNALGAALKMSRGTRPAVQINHAA